MSRITSMDDALLFLGGFYWSKNRLTDRKTTTFVSLLLIWMWLGTRLNEFPLLLYSPGVRTALRRGNAPRPTDKGWSVCGAETESWCERSFSGGRRLKLKRQTPFLPHDNRHHHHPLFRSFPAQRPHRGLCLCWLQESLHALAKRASARGTANASLKTSTTITQISPLNQIIFIINSCRESFRTPLKV